ncbi:MAG: DUF4097 family beta strand repeat-containing protein [Planctomycetota bacterium]|nr:DUF4097 family beta strand repeat-containing protein [Planctomycetota bacterium]
MARVNRRSASLAVLGLVLLAGSAALSGCVIHADDSTYGDSYGSSRAFESTTVDRPAATKGRLVAESRNGSITVHRATDGKLHVEASMRSRSEGRVKDAALDVTDTSVGVRVAIKWPDGRWQAGDAADLEIWIPDADGLDLNSTNGDIEVGGFAGRLTATTSNAGITIKRHDGTVIARTSNADIEASDVTGDVDATTSNSSITLRDVTGRVVALTSNGDIDIHLAPSASGPVTATTSNSSITLLVGPGFTGELSASTSNGTVECTDARARSTRSGKSSEVFNFGSGTASKLATSNGDVTVKPR